MAFPQTRRWSNNLQVEHRRLAAARRTMQRDEFATADIEVDPIDDWCGLALVQPVPRGSASAAEIES